MIYCTIKWIMIFRNSCNEPLGYIQYMIMMLCLVYAQTETETETETESKPGVP